MEGNQVRPRPSVQRVVIDACVWHAAFLRDLIVHSAVADAIAPIWTPAIEFEWMRSVQLRRPDIDPIRIKSIARGIRSAIPSGCVPTPSIRKVPSFVRTKLPDPSDLHVIATAIATRTGIICTLDKRGFPHAALTQVGLAAKTPDQLLEPLVAHENPRIFEAMRMHRTSLRAPPVDPRGYVAMLKRNALAETARALEIHSDRMPDCL